MLTRASRLTTDKDYAAVYRRGRRFRARGFSCSILATPSPTRIGVVVSKKVSLKATVRNRYKRWLWAACRELKERIPKRGYHFVLAVNPNIANLTYQDVCSEFQYILSQLPHDSKN